MSFVVLWRHAPTPANENGVVQGRLDVGLSDAGLRQARRAAKAIVTLREAPVTLREAPVTLRAVAGPPPPTLRIYSSPLLRAVQTAEALAALAGEPVLLDESFTQRSYGAWEGRTWAEIRLQYPEEFARRQAGLDPRIPGWDGQEAVAARVLAGLERVWDPARPAVIVSHGSPITLGLLAAIGEPASSTILGRLPHASWAMVRRVESGTWHIDQFAAGAD